MNNEQLLTRQDLLPFFFKDETATEKIGIEVELGVVNPDTGLSIPYKGTTGVSAILSALLKTDRWIPIVDGGHIFGLRRADGTKVSLEAAGTIEYSSPPIGDIETLVRTTEQEVLKMAEVTRELGAVLIAGSMLPFDKLEDTKWSPNDRYGLILDYLNNLGIDSLGKCVMARCISTQVTFDYVSEEDMNRKMRSLVAAVPVSNALFANSPIEEGVADGTLSHRSRYWLRWDPARCGCLPPALSGSMTFNDYIDWAIQIPMMVAVVNGVCQPMYGRTFASVLEHGFEDGTKPTFDNWRAHFSSIYTDIRLRNTIEIRSMDGLPLELVPGACAFWTGLVYHQPSVESLWKLFQNRTIEDYQKAQAEVCYKGLEAKYGNDSVRELALEMVKLAKEGLQARVNAGLEQPTVLKYLDPIEEIAVSGKTFAERLIERWKGEFDYSPANYVEAYRVK
ncbi:glutamate-cysteine ligase family protein [Nostoc sp. PCC 9305]|uniref:glutamate-cysteine ligase family protein n=1 Tax=Nostoc sp. PCC 9305 TaxID=296636 RepID=UPI0039C73318